MSELKRTHQSNPKKLLRRTQQFLVELKTTLTLLREVLIEFKELVVVLALIAFFIYEVIKSLLHLDN